MEIYLDRFYGLLSLHGLLERKDFLTFNSFNLLYRKQDWTEEQWIQYLELNRQLDYYHRYTNAPVPREGWCYDGDTRYVEDNPWRYDTRYDYVIIDPKKINNQDFDLILKALVCIIPELDTGDCFKENFQRLDTYIIVKFSLEQRDALYSNNDDLEWAEDILRSKMDMGQEYLLNAIRT